MESVKKIPWEGWSRKELFDFFSGMSQPFYSVTFAVDVTNLCQFTKDRGLSFYYSLVYLCTRAINQVEAFRYAISGKDLILLDERIPSFTDLKPGADTFHIVTMPCGSSLTEFSRTAREKSRSQTTFINPSAETGDLIYFSCLPWVELTALTNERNFDPDDTVPRVAWGKYAEENGRKKLHISLELNHRFIDGLHVGRFYEALSRMIAEL